MPEPDSLPNRYLAERITQYQAWYDRKSVTCKLRYLVMRTSTIVAGAMVPVLANLPESSGFPVVRALITGMSLLVVILVSLDSVFQCREQWKNYRFTEQFLGHEKFHFLAGVGVYKGMNEQEAFQLLAGRVEKAIAAENAATPNVMTLGETSAST
jgi:hypothetical protein